MDLSFQNETQISKNFSRKNEESQGLMGFKAFIGEDSSAVIAQIRDIRDQMRVIKLKRELEKEKTSYILIREIRISACYLSPQFLL